jgi:hypothetical protein
MPGTRRHHCLHILRTGILLWFVSAAVYWFSKQLQRQLFHLRMHICTQLPLSPSLNNSLPSSGLPEPVVSQTWSPGVSDDRINHPLRGNAPHTLMLTFQTFDPNQDCAVTGSRIWMAVLGQLSSGGEHWIICSAGIGIHMGAWGGPQINTITPGKSDSLFPLISDNRIHALATTLDASNRYSIYLDGLMIASMQFPDDPFNIVDPGLSLIASAFNNYEQSLNVRYYKAQVWDVALTASQMGLAVRGDVSPALSGLS